MGSERGAPFKTQAPNRPKSSSLPLGKALPLPTKATSWEARQQKIPGSLPMPRPLQWQGRGDSGARGAASPTQGRHDGQALQPAAGPPPGQAALLWYVPVTLTRAGSKQGWLPPAMLQQMLEVGARGNPWNQQQSSCLAAVHALNAP